MELFQNCNQLQGSIETFIPKECSKTTTEIKPESTMRNIIRQKHRAWQRYIETKEGETYIAYKVKSLTRQAKIEIKLNVSKTAKINSKSFWQYVPSNTKTKEGIQALRNPTQMNKRRHQILRKQK